MRQTPKQPTAHPHNGIGLQNEKSLHAALKTWYAQPGDQFEVKVDGYIVDIVRGDLLIEIQTRNFAAIRRKLHRLVECHPLRLVYPIAQEKWIVHRAARGGATISRRKSPKTGQLVDLFDELVSIPDLINHDNFSLDVVMMQEEEIRQADGRGSWRRKGHSIVDHMLVQVIEVLTFQKKEDFLRLLPPSLEQPFTNRQLARQAKFPLHVARKVTYCLRKMELIRMTGKSGRELLFEIAAS